LQSSDIKMTADSHHIQQKQNADDTQVYATLSTYSYNNALYTAFFPKLHGSKPPEICSITSQHTRSLSAVKSINMAGSAIPLSDQVKILGVTLDSCLTMGSHVKSCLYNICSFRQIRPSPVNTMATSTASDSILGGCPQKHIFRLQRVQNSLTKVVVQQRSSSSASVEKLHWLPVVWCIQFKNCYFNS